MDGPEEQADVTHATCAAVEGCIKPAASRGWCGMHYYRWRTFGSFELPERPIVTCSINDCVRTGKLTRGWCQMHYARWCRYGDPLFSKYVRSDPITRFWAYVELHGEDDCWPWLGYVTPDGYGRFEVGGKNHNPARWICEQVGTPVPKGYEVDHLCRNRSCVNYVSHLEIVTKKVNVLRGFGPTAINARKTKCDHGHEFTPENTIWRPSGHRGCRTCHRLADHRRVSIAS